MLRLTDSPLKLELPLFSAQVPAGFPSPADDHIEGKLDLNEHLVRRPAATFFVRASGDLNALPRLHEVLSLLEDVELLADDAATLVGADVMKAAIKDLHFQQASVQMAIAQLQAVKSRSPWATPWPWISVVALVWLFVSLVS